MQGAGFTAGEAARARDLTALLSPRSIAIVGASERNSFARRLLAHLNEWSFAGSVYAVNPRNTTVGGRPCVPSLKALPEPVDLAVVLVGRSSVLEVLRDSQLEGIPAAIVITSGFADSGETRGRQLGREMVALAAETGLMVCGPNCLGLINFHSAMPLFAGPVDMRPAAGKLAVVSQSGGSLCAILNAASERSIGLSYAISSGNEAILDFCDYVDYLLDDDRTDVICGLLESIPDPERFRRTALRAAQARKPIVLIKIGRSRAGSEAALAHTGALASPDDLVQTLFDETGIIRADGVDDALDKATLFAFLPRSQWPHGRNVAFFSVGGGAVGIFADYADRAGITLPPLPGDVAERLTRMYPDTASFKNPMDLPGWQAGQRTELMPLFLEECLQHDEFDGVIAAGLSYRHLHSGLERAAAAGVQHEKPLIVTLFSATSLPAEAHRFTDHGIPVIAGLDRCIRAYEASAAYQRAAVRKPADRRPRHARSGVLEILEGTRSADGVLNPLSAAKLLETYALSVPKQLIAGSADDAATAATTIGYPVAVKLADVLHKTDVGGVRLWLQDDHSVREAYVAVTSGPSVTGSSARVLVQEMVHGLAEIYLGISNHHAAYPPLILVGFGGVYAEVLRDVERRFVPLSTDDAREMLERLRAHDLVFGYRGTRPDTSAVVTAIVSLSELAIELRDHVVDLDINPLLVGSVGEGVRVVDAKVMLRRSRDVSEEGGLSPMN